MSAQQYKQLLVEFCQLTGIEDADELCENGNLSIDGIGFTMTGPQTPEDDLLHIYCNFGEVAEQEQSVAYRRLLEVNLLTPHIVNFSVTPESGDVLLHYRSPIKKATSESLLLSMKLCVEEAKRWRETRYLEDASNTAKISRAGGTMTGILRGFPS